MTIGTFLAGALALELLGTPRGRAGEAVAVAVAVRAVRPDVQGERLIGLFRGSRAASPAAALAAWKHATGGRFSLGKPLEAALAALNPPMARELKILDGAELLVGFAPGGPTRWQAVVPNDDGSLAAMATALALTDGAREDPLGGVPVLPARPARRGARREPTRTARTGLDPRRSPARPRRPPRTDRAGRHGFRLARPARPVRPPRNCPRSPAAGWPRRSTRSAAAGSGAGSRSTTRTF